MNKAKSFSIMGSLVLSLTLIGTGCGSNDQDGVSDGTSTQVMENEPTTARVQRRDVVGYDLIPGELYTPPESQAVAYAPYRAPVERVLTSVGQRVRRGESLIELAPPAAGYDPELNYEQARANVEAARVALQQAEAQNNTAVREARRQLESARESERQLRQQTLPGGDASALSAARDARTAAQDTLARAQADLNAAVLPYRQQLEYAQAAAQEARAGVRQSMIKAPLSGTVVDLRAQPGQEVGRTTREEVARIVDLSDLQVKAQVSAEQSASMKEGTSVVLTFNEFPDRTFDGRVGRIRALPAENDRVRYETTINFSNDEGLIKPNMQVKTIGVKVGQVNDALTVPVGAVDRDETGKPIVRVLQGQNWSPTVVELGLTDGEFVVVKSGLQEGQTIQVVPSRNEVGKSD